MVPRLRIFLSSPGDVSQERLRAHLVIQKLARDFQRYFTIEPFLWEYEPQLASKHFQDAIDPPSSFDIVLLFVWSRLGTALPEKTAVREYRGIDGRAPVTGTEWEFEEALQANRARGGKGPPDLLVYRRMGGATAALEDPAKRDEAIRQYDALEEFWRRWFKSERSGGLQFLAGYTEYHEPEEFDRRLEADLSKLIQRHIKDRHLDEAAPLWLKGSPFRGLAAYDFDDAPVFFGRDGESREGLTRLAEAAGRGTAFLMVSGPSGSGKSSLARAGLLPSLVATKAVAEVGLWRRVVMRPGDAGGDPVLALARALIAGDPAKGEGLAELAGARMTAEELAQHLAAGGNPAFLFTKTLRGLADAERTRLGLLPHEQARLVLVVDQLEEIFTRPEIEDKQRSLFAGAIAALAGSSVVWVIATMRSDLRHRLDEVTELRYLGERGGAARLALAAPDAAQLLEIIRQPAQAAGLAFDTDPATGLALDAMLAKEAAAQPGVLPLLSVMLDDLYDRDVAKGGSDGLLTVASYRALGGLRAAIAQRAESRLQSLQETDAAAAGALPRVLRALVTAGAAGDVPAARPVPLPTFAASSPEHRLVEALIAADARLLTVEDRGTGPEVRLAHEALIENWPRAKTIIGESGNFIRVRDDIEAQRRKWEDAKRPGELLLASGLPLAEAENIDSEFGGELSPEVRAFVKASRSRARRFQQRVAAAAVFFFVFAMTATVAGVIAYRAQQEATAQKKQAVQSAQRATENYEAARNTVESLYTGIAKNLQNLDQISIPTVEEALTTALGLVDKLEAESAGDPLLKRTRANMYYQFAETFKAASDQDRVLKAAKTALDVRDDLVKLRPYEPEWLWDLGLSFDQVGDAERAVGLELNSKGDAQAAAALLGARADYDRALAIRELLVRDHLDRAEFEYGLSLSHVRIGDLKAYPGNDTAGAQAEYEKALEVSKDVFKREPENVDWQRELSWAYKKVGDIHMQAREYPLALEAHQNSLCARRYILSSHESNTLYQRDVAYSLESIADVKRRANDSDGAQDPLFEALAIRRRLSESDESKRLFLRELADTLGRVGDLKNELKPTELATGFYLASINIRIRLLRRAPEDSDEMRRIQNQIGDMEMRVAGARQRMGASGGAVVGSDVLVERARNEESSLTRRPEASGTRNPIACWGKLKESIGVSAG